MLREQSRDAVLRAHASGEFDPSTDIALTYKPGGSTQRIPFLAMNPDMASNPTKRAISDFDGVLNRYGTPDPMMFYLEYVFDKNYGMGQKKRDVLYRIKMLQKGEDVPSTTAVISHVFRSCGVTKGLHARACEYAADSFSLVSNYASALERLRDMGYKLFVLSASPKELISSARGRLQIRPDDVEATRFIFDSHGVFLDMEINLGETRVAGRDMILKKFEKTDCGLDIMIDDNFETGVKAPFPNVNIWVGDAPEIRENISVVKKEARTDFNQVPETIKRLERGFAATLLMDEARYKKAINLAHKIVDRCWNSDSMSGQNLFQNGTNLVEEMGVYLEDMRGLFPSRKTEIYGDMRDLRIECKYGKDERAVKIMIKKLYKKFYGASIEAKLPRDLFDA